MCSQVLTELAGTMGYMAPEVLRRCYSEAADVWSTGVMLYEMIAGQLPFNLGHTCEEVSSWRHAGVDVHSCRGKHGFCMRGRLCWLCLIGLLHVDASVAACCFWCHVSRHLRGLLCSGDWSLWADTVAAADLMWLRVAVCLLLQCLANIEDADLDLSCPAWQAAAPEARKLVSAMLAKDPMKRPPAQKLLDEYSSWLSRGNQLPAEEAQAEQ